MIRKLQIGFGLNPKICEIFGLASFLLLTFLLDAGADEPSVKEEGEDSAVSSWPMHRGGPQLSGRAAVKIADAIELVWTFDTGQSVYSSAAIEDRRVFVGSNSGKVHALDLKSGEELWSFSTGGPVEATPCLIEGIVYVGSSDSVFYALDAASGELRWKFQTSDRILGGANWTRIPEFSSNLILFGSYDGSVYCLDAVKGDALWKYSTGSFVNGTPAILSGGRAAIGGCDNFIYVIRIKDGEPLEKVDTEAYIAGSIAVFEGKGYLGHYSNAVIAFDTDTADILWTYNSGSFPFFSSAAVTSTNVLIGGRDRLLHCLDRDSGRSVWTFQTRGQIDSSPVVGEERVVFGSNDGRLYAVDLSNGGEVWSYEVGAPLVSSPAVVDGWIVIGSEDGKVYAFRGKALRPAERDQGG